MLDSNQLNQLNMNPFTKPSKQWMLITARKNDQINTMTAAWGGFGYLWNKNVAFIFVRPQRYTKQFIDASDELSLSFYDEQYRPTLTYLGRVSGKDENKIKKSNFHPAFYHSIPYFVEANTVLFGKKLYCQQLQESSFYDSMIAKQNYPENDYHYMYVIEITDLIIKK